MNSTLQFQANLLLPKRLEPTQQDVDDLIFLNSIAPGDVLAPSIYSLKDFLTKSYGIPDGYNRQLFWKYAWNEPCERSRNDVCKCEDQPCQIWSTHIHFLERRILGDHLFHLPTPSFIYRNAYGIIVKQAGTVPPFKSTIYGRKKSRVDYSTNEMFMAAMRMTLKYGCYFNNSIFKILLSKGC